MTQRDVNKTSASLWDHVHKVNVKLVANTVCLKVHGTIYSAEPVSIVNRLSFSENEAAAAGVVTD